MKFITHTSNKRRDQRNTGLCARNSLSETEKKGQVAVDLVFLLELPRGLDTLPCAGDLDEDALLGDANGGIESDEFSCFGFCAFFVE